MTRHRFDPVAFLFGLLCTAVAIVALTGVTGLRVQHLPWAGPALVILLGVAVLLTATGRGERGVAQGTAAADGSGPESPTPDVPRPDSPTPDVSEPESPTPDVSGPESPTPDAPAGSDAGTDLGGDLAHPRPRPED